MKCVRLCFFQSWWWREIRLFQTRFEASYSCWDSVGFTTFNSWLFTSDQHSNDGDLERPQKWIQAIIVIQYVWVGGGAASKLKQEVGLLIWEGGYYVGKPLNSHLWSDYEEMHCKTLSEKVEEEIWEETVGLRPYPCSWFWREILWEQVKIERLSETKVGLVGVWGGDGGDTDLWWGRRAAASHMGRHPAPHHLSHRSMECKTLQFWLKSWVSTQRTPRGSLDPPGSDF